MGEGVGGEVQLLTQATYRTVSANFCPGFGSGIV